MGKNEEFKFENNQIKKIVIIGNGIAGLSAANAARKTDPDIDILIISNETYLTYYRLRLCEYISGTIDIDALLIHKDEWYKKNNINVLLEKNVNFINVAEKYLILNSEEKIFYSKLIISSGSYSFLPPTSGIQKEGVFTLRNLKDAEVILNEVSKIESLTVIGSGPLGLEFAYQFRAKCKNINLLERRERLLPNLLDENASSFFEEKVKSLGINIIKNVTAKEITGNKRVQGVTLDNGDYIKTDSVLVSAGIRPNLELLKDSELIIKNGIVVNNFMQTNIESIYAAGDIAEYNNKMFGLWTIAMNQGNIAGTNAAGGGTMYKDEIPPFYLNCMDIKLYSIGDITSGLDNNIMVSSPDKLHYKKFFFKEDVLIGAILMGDVSIFNRINMAIKNKVKRDSLNDIF